jgi:uncharacterized protein (DUF1330 family)
MNLRNGFWTLSGSALLLGIATTVYAATMPPPAKAYVIGEFTVTNPQGYKQYAAMTGPVVAKFGGVYLARGGKTESVEGPPPAGRIVVIEFPSLAAAQAFEAAPEYRAITPIRQRASTGRVFLVEGAPR